MKTARIVKPKETLRIEDLDNPDKEKRLEIYMKRFLSVGILNSSDVNLIFGKNDKLKSST